MKTPPPEPFAKVWQAPGFTGLELEQLESVPSFDQRTYHTTFEINVLLHGESRVHYRQDRWAGRVTEADPWVFVQGVDEVSKVMATTPTSVRMRNLRISPELMSALSTTDRDTPPVAFPQLSSEDPAVNRLLARLAVRLFNAFDELAGRLARETALLDLTAAAVRHLAERAPPPRGARREHQAVALAKIRLRDRLAQDVTLDDLAALTRLNKFHLLEVFRRDVGVSPHVYLTHLRIHEAKRLLAKGRPIAEVAYTVGFADQSHLNRQFKRLVSGVTPGRYQRDSR